MIKQIEKFCCEGCGEPKNNKNYDILANDTSVVPALTLCENCLKELREEITAILATLTT